MQLVPSSQSIGSIGFVQFSSAGQHTDVVISSFVEFVTSPKIDAIVDVNDELVNMIIGSLVLTLDTMTNKNLVQFSSTKINYDWTQKMAGKVRLQTVIYVINVTFNKPCPT